MTDAKDPKPRLRQLTEEQMAAIRAGDRRVLTRKLKPTHVRAIRGLFVETAHGRFRGKWGLTMEQVAREYGVNGSTISAIVRRETWRHL